MQSQQPSGPTAVPTLPPINPEIQNNLLHQTPTDHHTSVVPPRFHPPTKNNSLFPKFLRTGWKFVEKNPATLGIAVGFGVVAGYHSYEYYAYYGWKRIAPIVQSPVFIGLITALPSFQRSFCKLVSRDTVRKTGILLFGFMLAFAGGWFFGAFIEYASQYHRICPPVRGTAPFNKSKYSKRG